MNKSNAIRPSTNCANNDFGIIPAVSQEKWEQIFCKLNQNDVAKARLVCPNWRTIIDNLYKFSITIMDRLFEELPVPFKVMRCFIYQLKKDADRIFKYSYNVEHLKINDKVNLSTLRNIFEETNSLKKLDFANSYNVSGTEICMPKEPVNFKSLLQLKVVLNNRNYFWGKGEADITNTQRIFSYKMPYLARLDLRMIELFNTFDKILPSFFKFLAKHSKTIKQLRASFIPDLIFGDERPTLLSEEIFNEMQPQNIMRLLHDPEFQVTTLILALTTRYFRLWTRIINNQNKLITFYTEYIEDQFVDRFYFVPFATIQPTLVRNASTFVNLHLTGLTLEINRYRDVDPRACRPIDGLLFQDFNKLRRLILRRSIVDAFGLRGIQINETTFVNISSIPLEILEVLEIGWFVCETSELERLVENAPRLKIVIFHFTGYFDGKGVTTEIIDNLAKKRDIHIIDVIPVNLHPNETAAQKKLTELEIEYPEAIQIRHEGNYHFYFNFDRFRNSLFQETYYTQYKHPLFFE